MRVSHSIQIGGFRWTTTTLNRARLPGGIDPMIKEDWQRGRARIIVDEWGPYDWKSPKLWPAGRSDENPLTLACPWSGG